MTTFRTIPAAQVHPRDVIVSGVGTAARVAYARVRWVNGGHTLTIDFHDVVTGEPGQWSVTADDEIRLIVSPPWGF